MNSLDASYEMIKLKKLKLKKLHSNRSSEKQTQNDIDIRLKTFFFRG